MFRAFSGLPSPGVLGVVGKVDLTAGPETELSNALAVAEERVDSAEGRLRRLEDELERAHGVVGRLRSRMASSPSEGVEAELEAAEVHLATVERRTLKARAVRDLAREELTEIVSDRS